jgi:NTP pyrophosphatase (non-canonical NTP hydrolase)
MNNLINLIKPQHAVKFPKSTPEIQIAKIIEELAEVFMACNLSKEEYNKELCDVIISCIGLMRFTGYKLMAEAIIRDCMARYTGSDLIGDVLKKWDIVLGKEYKDGFHH